LRKLVAPNLPGRTRIEDLLALLPSYAREEVKHFRNWKRRYIRENRDWWVRAQQHVPPGWAERLRGFPSSLRKLEWNVKGGERDLWRYVLQFRPSGLRAKRYSSSPALVAMTETQIPILGPEERFLTRVEGRRLQGFRDDHFLPESRTDAFRALGNGVHVEVVKLIAARLLGHAPGAVEGGALRKAG
jgi:DNA (cytosine-5)-methyltransferase 1